MRLGPLPLPQYRLLMPLRQLKSTETMKAIIIKRTAITNPNPDPAFRARCVAGALRLDCDDRLGYEENAARAGAALVSELGWQDHGTWALGCLPNGDFAYVCAVRK